MRDAKQQMSQRVASPQFKSMLADWLEEYLFFPTPFQQLISILLLPLTLIYCLILTLKKSIAKPVDFGIPVISIGNLVVGGSGKTPVTISLAKETDDAAVVLRGYGRSSKGLHIVSQNGKLLLDVDTSGDEAMLLAKSLPNTTIIVSENREKGIQKAKELGAKLVFLDDGFSKYNIKKFDILIRPKDEPTNLFCLPSGGYREPKIMYATADLVLTEGKDFKRIVTIKKDGKTVKELPQNLVLLTAISKPNRLFEYLPQNTRMIAFEDHHNFTKDEVDNILQEFPDCSLITTGKDLVKLEKILTQNDKYKKLDIYLMDLEISINRKSIITVLELLSPIFLKEI